MMRQIGHTDPAFTLRVYAQLISRDPADRECLRALVQGERVFDAVRQIDIPPDEVAKLLRACPGERKVATIASCSATFRRGLSRALPPPRAGLRFERRYRCRRAPTDAWVGADAYLGRRLH